MKLSLITPDTGSSTPVIAPNTVDPVTIKPTAIGKIASFLESLAQKIRGTKKVQATVLETPSKTSDVAQAILSPKLTPVLSIEKGLEILLKDLETLQDSVLSPGDFTRFFRHLFVRMEKEELQNPEKLLQLEKEETERKEKGLPLTDELETLRKTQMFMTLRSLTETKEEQALIESIIDKVNQEKESTIGQSIDKLLTQHKNELPRSLRYLLVAGSQTGFGPLTITLASEIVSIGGDLYTQASSKRKIDLQLKRDKEEAFSEITIIQEQEMTINSIQEKEVVIRVPLRLTTNIRAGSKEIEVDILCPTKPIVDTKPSAPTYATYTKLAQTIEATFAGITKKKTLSPPVKT